MVDIVDKLTRSRMMSGIRSENTKPEILTRRALHRLGYRYRTGNKIGKIKPDIVLVKCKVAIFVHGCYWHQHEGCRLAYSDRSYSDKWKKKFTDNNIRDSRIEDELLASGWRVAVIWECVTRDQREFDKMLVKLNKWINDSSSKRFESKYKKT